MSDGDCCCWQHDNKIARCFSRALDLGHCGPEYAAHSWCCGGSDTAKVAAIVAVRSDLPPRDRARIVGEDSA